MKCVDMTCGAAVVTRYVITIHCDQMAGLVVAISDDENHDVDDTNWQRCT